MDTDLEKGIQEAIGARHAQIPPTAGGEEKKLIPDLPDSALVTDGGVIAANMKVNPGKKSLRCWLVITATVMILTNHIQSAPKYQLIPLELMAIFTMLMCAIFLVFHTMKKM